MRTNIIRSMLLILPFGLSSVAQAQYGGYSASAYNSYSAQPSAVPVHPSLQARQAPAQPAAPTYATQQPGYAAPSPNYGGPQANYAAPQPNYAPPQANYGYQPPQNFRTVAQHNGGYEAIAAPQPTPAAMQGGHVAEQVLTPENHSTMGQPVSQPMNYASGDPNCSTCNQVGSGATYSYAQPNVYVQAANAPSCGGSCETSYGAACYSEPVQVNPWFGGMSILFLTRDDNYDRPLVFDDAMPSTTRLSARDAGLDFALGYDVTVGRYIGCGQYAISATWLHIENDESDQSIMPPAAGGYRANFRSWDRIYFDQNNDGMHSNVGMPATDESVYAHFDRAESFRVRRDASYYGLEVNLSGFGIGGASRAGRPSCGGSCGSDPCGPPTGCGGLCGPMVPSCNAKMQLQWNTGLRWFHFEDEMSFSARTERFPAAPAMIETVAYDVDAQNELFGWQLGGQLSYCLGSRTSLYAGGKVGWYANDASLRQNFRSGSMPARVTDSGAYPSYANQSVSREYSDTVLATLAEIDLGIGYRICDCWTVRGGYRMLAAGGVATAIDNLSENPANLGAQNVWADSNLVLHGGYVGLDYNW
ncbi:hypothetical protein CA51_06800 [Rosistilla oblonga]|nr:hypothetical protein CA51_06800 [Rosistilla oblonga]